MLRKNVAQDVLVGAGLLLVLAAKAPMVVVAGLLWLAWLNRGARTELAWASAVRAAVLGGMVGGLLTLLLPAALSVLSGARSLQGVSTAVSAEPAAAALQELSFNLFGRALLALAESALLGLSVKLLLPGLER